MGGAHVVSCVQFTCVLCTLYHTSQWKSSQRGPRHTGGNVRKPVHLQHGSQHLPEIQPGWTVVGWCPGCGMDRLLSARVETHAGPGSRASVGCVRSSGLPWGRQDPVCIFSALGLQYRIRLEPQLVTEQQVEDADPVGTRARLCCFLVLRLAGVFPLGLYTDPSLELDAPSSP